MVNKEVAKRLYLFFMNKHGLTLDLKAGSRIELPAESKAKRHPKKKKKELELGFWKVPKI